MRQILVISLLVNVLLAVFYLIQISQPTFSLGRASESVADNSSLGGYEPKEAIPKTEGADWGSLGNDYESYIDKGLTDRQAKQLIFANLADFYISPLAKPADRYWRDGFNTEYLKYQREYLLATQKMQGDLVSIFGNESYDDPIFQSAFRPWQEIFPFLSGEQQQALKLSDIEGRLRLLSLRANSHKFNGNDKLYLETTIAISNTKIIEILGEEKYFEFSLRFSEQADHLRRCDFAFTEESFRHIFSAIAQSFSGEENGGDGRLERLEDLIGSESAIKVMSCMDVKFGEFLKIAKNYNLDDSHIYASYGIMTKSNENIIEIQRTHIESWQARKDMIAYEIMNCQAELIDLVGDDAAENLMKYRQI